MQGCDATFGVLVTEFARLGTPPALHGRGSTRTMHGVRPGSHRSRIVTSTHLTAQDLGAGRRFRFGAIGLATDRLAGAYSRDVRVAPGMRWACQVASGHREGKAMDHGRIRAAIAAIGVIGGILLGTNGAAAAAASSAPRARLGPLFRDMDGRRHHRRRPAVRGPLLHAGLPRNHEQELVHAGLERIARPRPSPRADTWRTSRRSERSVAMSSRRSAVGAPTRAAPRSATRARTWIRSPRPTRRSSRPTT